MRLERRSLNWIFATSLITPIAALLQPALAALGIPLIVIGLFAISIGYLAITFRHHKDGSLAQWSYYTSYTAGYSRNETLVLASAAAIVASGTLTVGVQLLQQSP
jgi:hypothetical protein